MILLDLGSANDCMVCCYACVRGNCSCSSGYLCRDFDGCAFNDSDIRREESISAAAVTWTFET